MRLFCVRQIGELAQNAWYLVQRYDAVHESGARVYVDGVHATAHRPTDVRALGADFYVTSAYKWSGPHYAAAIADPSDEMAAEALKLAPAANRVEGLDGLLQEGLDGVVRLAEGACNPALELLEGVHA